MAVTTTVMRDGEKLELPLSQLVPGDIVLLSVGDIVPAGCRIIQSKDLFIDQSALTGESMPAEKIPGVISKDKVDETSEWTNYLFMGTSVISGSATAVVVRTGRSTQYAQIVERLVQRRPLTEFERSSRKFGYLIMQVTIVLVVAVFLINALNDRNIIQSLLFSIALAVGLTPELLPMIIMINLSEGALHMSKKDVVVKRLESIQNYGSMDVLCTDKTGTLTENKVSLVKFVDILGEDDQNVLRLSFVNSLFGTGLRSPLDGAILAHKEVEAKEFEKLDEIPFDFVRKRMSVVVKNGAERIMVTKGAPEEMQKCVTSYEVQGKVLPLDDETKKQMSCLSNDLSTDGLRLLGVAYKKIDTTRNVLHHCR